MSEYDRLEEQLGWDVPGILELNRAGLESVVSDLIQNTEVTRLLRPTAQDFVSMVKRLEAAAEVMGMHKEDYAEEYAEKLHGQVYKVIQTLQGLIDSATSGESSENG